MPNLSSVLKAAIPAATVLLVAGTAQAEPGNLFKQPMDNWEQGQEAAIRQGLAPDHCWHPSSVNDPAYQNIALQEWVSYTNNENEQHHRSDGSFKISSHPTFPEYSVRYKSPNICDPNVKQYSGYLDIEEDKHFFFWFFESRNNPKDDPLILWLNGGPGCSSLIGLFTELGPCLINVEGDDTILNEHSWNNNASIIFLDQPLNVGYSYSKYDTLTSTAAAKDMYAFLQLFFKEFPQYSALDLHIAGESYGGHYVPAIGGEIHRNNKRILSDGIDTFSSSLSAINLKSLMLGNGLTDPLTQYKYYPMMACNNSYGPVLDQAICDQMEADYPACAALISKCYMSQNMLACMPAVLQCNHYMTDPYEDTGRNTYDVRKMCDDEGVCYESVENLPKYLNRPDIMQAIGAQVAYSVCNDNLAYPFLIRDWMLPYVNEIPPLLEDGVRVLVYSGDADFACNWMGNKAWTIELPWSGHDEFLIATDTPWFSETANEQGGELRRTKDGRFAFLRVFDAGHMVPLDRGDFAIDMLNNWIHGELA